MVTPAPTTDRSPRGEYNFLRVAWSTFISLSKLGTTACCCESVERAAWWGTGHNGGGGVVLKQNVYKVRKLVENTAAQISSSSFARITFWWSDYRVGEAVGMVGCGTKLQRQNRMKLVEWSYMCLRVWVMAEKPYWLHSSRIFNRDALDQYSTQYTLHIVRKSHSKGETFAMFKYLVKFDYIILVFYWSVITFLPIKYEQNHTYLYMKKKHIANIR